MYLAELSVLIYGTTALLFLIFAWFIHCGPKPIHFNRINFNQINIDNNNIYGDSNQNITSFDQTSFWLCLDKTALGGVVGMI